MEKLVREFIQYCFDHGSFLRNHKDFGELSRNLVAEAIKVDLQVHENPIAQTIIHRQLLSEIQIPVFETMSYRASEKYSPSERAPIFILVYRFERKVKDFEYLYRFSGGRIS